MPCLCPPGLESGALPPGWGSSAATPSGHGSDASPLNLLPVAPPFNAGMGLHPRSPYFMLIARNIMPAGQLQDFKAYVARECVGA